MYWIILEGLAVVFERDLGGAKHSWKKYGDDEVMQTWLTESKQPRFVVAGDWVGKTYKLGAWIVDRAIKHSGKSIVELTAMSRDEIMHLTQV